MTKEELRRKIAEALGWTQLSWGKYLCAHVLSGYEPATKEWRVVPNWPTDEGAALALCLEARNRLNAQADAGEWALVFASDLFGDTVGLLFRCNGEDTHAITAEGHDAEALARLALEALTHD